MTLIISREKKQLDCCFLGNNNKIRKENEHKISNEIWLFFSSAIIEHHHIWRDEPIEMRIPFEYIDYLKASWGRRELECMNIWHFKFRIAQSIKCNTFRIDRLRLCGHLDVMCTVHISLTHSLSVCLCALLATQLRHNGIGLGHLSLSIYVPEHIKCTSSAQNNSHNIQQ